MQTILTNASSMKNQVLVYNRHKLINNNMPTLGLKSSTSDLSSSIISIDELLLPNETSTYDVSLCMYLTSNYVNKLIISGSEAEENIFKLSSTLLSNLSTNTSSTSSSSIITDERIIPLETILQYFVQEKSNNLQGIIINNNTSSISSTSLAINGSPYTHILSPYILANKSTIIHTQAYARVGLLGNPSDGYGGKTLAVTISNFRAEAWLCPNKNVVDSTINLVPHPFSDPLHFPNLQHLSTVSNREGYSGGIRLMMAALHRFYSHCAKRNIKLSTQGYSVWYHTIVPRQVGLAGSSAILTAFLRAIMKFYGYGTEELASKIDLNRNLLPAFVLAIETEELGITAGLQDRVVQAYEGCVHMNFNSELIKTNGYGTYTRLAVSCLPPLFLAYCADPSDSGRIHAPVKQRWLAGDPEVVNGMITIANLADEGKLLGENTSYGKARTTKDKEQIVHEWARVIAENFNNRRKLFGDPALGKDNIRMIEIARECGASGKFPGSGGAIVGVIDVFGIEQKGKLVSASKETVPTVPALTADDKEQENATNTRLAIATDILRAAYHAEGYVFIRLRPFENEN